MSFVYFLCQGIEVSFVYFWCQDIEVSFVYFGCQDIEVSLGLVSSEGSVNKLRDVIWF